MIEYQLDRDTRVLEGGLKIVGGSPMSVIRLGPRGREVLLQALHPEHVQFKYAERALLSRLVSQGLLHPRFGPVQDAGRSVSVVIPALQEADRIGNLVRSLGYAAEVIVVDDGSTDGTADRAAAAGARVILNSRSLGPAAARNRGAISAKSDFIAFLDADCEPPPTDWLDRLLSFILNGAADLVAPRVTGGESREGKNWIESYEIDNCPLDMGTDPSVVGPGRRVGYVPSAAMLVDRVIFEQAGGFDESLRFGEDVDLVWRLVKSGRKCRFEPAVRVPHRPRGSIVGIMSQHFRYGGSAVALDAKHHGDLAPARGRPRSLIAALALPAVGPGPLIASAGVNAHRFRASEVPLTVRQALAAGIAGELSVSGSVLRALSREWLLPGFVITLLTRRWARFLLTVLSIIWLEDGRRSSGPAKLVAPIPGLATRVSYSAGLLLASLRHRSARAVLPGTSHPAGRASDD